MKLKSYLRGLGLGIIITTLILTVANNARMNSRANETSDITVAPIINYTKASTEAQTDNGTNSSQDTTGKQDESITKQQETVTPTVEPTTETPTEAPTEASDEGNSITVRLQNIVSSERAAQAIQQAGVIEDWSDFNNYLVRNGYATKIHDGTYILTKGQDYETIAQMITGR